MYVKQETKQPTQPRTMLQLQLTASSPATSCTQNIIAPQLCSNPTLSAPVLHDELLLHDPTVQHSGSNVQAPSHPSTLLRTSLSDQCPILCSLSDPVLLLKKTTAASVFSSPSSWLVRQAASLTSALCKLRQTKVGPRGDPCSMASHLQWCQPA